MDMEFRSGQMELSMRDLGRIIKLMAKEYFITLTETSLMENGNLIKQMGSESIYMLMELDTKAIGRTTFSTGLAKKNGLMVHGTKDITRLGKSVVRELTFGMMVLHIQVSGITTR